MFCRGETVRWVEVVEEAVVEEGEGGAEGTDAEIMEVRLSLTAWATVATTTMEDQEDWASGGRAAWVSLPTT